MKIGFSKKNITPPLPINLGGFAVERISHSVHDELFVKTMVLNEKGIYKGLIVYDLLAIDHLVIDKLSAIVKDDGIDLSNFIISATHTHSGPKGTIDTLHKNSLMYGKDEIFGSVNQDLIDRIVNQTAISLRQAIQCMEECTIEKVVYEVNGIGKNRNIEELQGDNRVIAFEITGNKSKNIIINYACHPTVLNYTNLKISADYPGSISEKLHDKYEHVIFLNGSCGDISTRFTRMNSGFEEVDRYGELFVQHLVKKVECLNKCEEIFKINKFEIKVNTKLPIPLSDAIKNIELENENVKKAVEAGVEGKELRLIESLSEGANADYVYSKYYNDIKEVSINISLVELFGEMFVTIPGEIFSELTHDLRREGIGVIGYAGGYLMYLANETAYDNRWYEALSSPFKKGEAERLVIEISEIARAYKEKK